MEPMDPMIHLEHARRAGEWITAVAESVDHATRVPSCPEWDLDGLFLHTGGFCRFARMSLEQNKFPEFEFSDYPGDNTAWHRGEHDRLITTLEETNPDEVGWSWGTDQRKAFWFRRAAQELAVHCWDAQNALGSARLLDPALAADGINELLVEFGRSPEAMGRDGMAKKYDRPGTTFHFHATDLEGGEWMVTARDDHFDVVHDHGKGDVAARATASDLLLFLWGRVPLDRLEVFGDVSLLERWRERVTI